MVIAIVLGMNRRLLFDWREIFQVGSSLLVLNMLLCSFLEARQCQLCRKNN